MRDNCDATAARGQPSCVVLMSGCLRRTCRGHPRQLRGFLAPDRLRTDRRMIMSMMATASAIRPAT